MRIRTTLCAAVGAWAGMACGQTQQTYSIVHAFEVTPKSNTALSIKIKHFEHAWSREFGPDDSASQVKPTVQPPGFANFAKDRANRYRNRIKNGGRVVVNQESVDVDPTTGTPAGGFKSKALALCALGTKGEAEVSVRVDPVGANGKVQGTINCSGSAIPVRNPPERSDAYAFSSAAIEVRAGRALRSGRIRWGPAVNAGRVAGAGISKGKTRAIDPILYEVVDLVDGTTYQGSLLHIEGSWEEGGVDWLGNLLVCNLMDGRFMVEMPGGGTSMGGGMVLEVQGGVVTRSEDDGAFDGVLPPAGAPGVFLATLPDLEFDYDLGDFSGHDLDVTLKMGGGGELEEGRGLHGRIHLLDYGYAGDRLEVYFDPAYSIRVEPINGDPPLEFTPDVDPFGDYNVEVDLSGPAAVYAKAAHWLRSVLDVMPDFEGNARADFKLVNGDCDDDNAVTVFDYNVLSGAFDTVPGDVLWDPRADLDGDDQVTVFDYNVLSSNFDKVGD